MIIEIAQHTELVAMKTIPEYYEVMIEAFLDAFAFGTVVSIAMAEISVIMLYGGRC